MERWKKWLASNFKKSFLQPSKAILFKVFSRLKWKTKEKRSGLVNLYEDKEACAEYSDIQVMWEMLHSSIYSKGPQTKTRKMSKCLILAKLNGCAF